MVRDTTRPFELVLATLSPHSIAIDFAGSLTAMSVVSIILPTYSRARLLPEAIASIRTQQFTDWDIVIGADAKSC